MLERLFGGGQSGLIQAAFGDIQRMLETSAEMLDLAIAALLDNQPLEVDLDRMDDDVDASERMVRRSVLEHLAINPGQDLVPSLILASVVQDAERIGDFARGVGELTMLAKRPREGEFRDQLKAAYAELRPRFPLCVSAFKKDDAEKAREVMQGHIQSKSRLDRLVEQIAGSDLPADMAVTYYGAARILRRISAHLSNLASTVVEPYDRIRTGDEAV